VRQLLSDKVSGTLAGLWLLVPEYLRLGAFDLLCGWSAQSGGRVEPRLALQLVNEAALCSTGIRHRRALGQRGFELACGLPYIASDAAIHELLAGHTVHEAQELQVALGLLRRQAGDYRGAVLAIDPHRVKSASKRHMRPFKDKKCATAQKQAQTFFCLDADTGQPLLCTTATASRTAAQAAMELMALSQRILPATNQKTLVLADTEHFSAELFDHVIENTPFDLLVPQPRVKDDYKNMAEIPPSQWKQHWAGYATTSRPYRLSKGRHPLHQFLQREGERPEEYKYKPFLCTAPRDELIALTQDYPARWHIEQFFDTDQCLGWKRAGTLNLNIRYGQMSMAMIAQAAINQLRKRLGNPFAQWEAPQLAKHLFAGLDGDIRVKDNTVLVTLYNTGQFPNLRQHYQKLPQILKNEGICPQIPWLYGLELDFAFR
jgi:hypothetical protein